jgi:hypothetical protein
VEGEDLAAVLERHGTAAAEQAALALRAGAAFWVRAESMQPASRALLGTPVVAGHLKFRRYAAVASLVGALGVIW